MQDNEMLLMYIEESREHLETIEVDLLAIEENGENIDSELVNKVFRAAHSIKGGAGFFDLTKIRDLSHRIENVLDMVRSKELVPTPEVINILLVSFDKLRSMINNHASSNEEEINDCMIALTGLASANLPEEKKATLTSSMKMKSEDGRDLFDVSEFDYKHAIDTGNYIYTAEIDLLNDIQRKEKNVLSFFKDLSTCGQILDSVLDIESLGTLDSELQRGLPFKILYATKLDPTIIRTLVDIDVSKLKLVEKPLSAQLEEVENGQVSGISPETRNDQAVPSPQEEKAELTPVSEAPPEPVPAKRTETAAADRRSEVAPVAETSLRVQVQLLETLMNLAGELVLSRNQLMEALGQNEGRGVQVSAQRINLVTSELQEAIMQTRMQSIGNIFNKFPRVVRDTARSLGKEINLTLSGKEVEMDKTIIEGLSDPLTHMVRNSVDHGIETPEVRASLGKNPVGQVKLSAYHEAGQVVIEIADDGKGIDADKIAASAVSKGVVTQEQVKKMSKSELLSLIFLPGMSTAEKVTDVSGRGVGMDVVRTNLDRLGGNIEIDTDVGKGSTFRIKLPLTLAIMPCLLVSCEGERFALPQTGVQEMIRIPASQIQKKIELIGDAEVLALRDTLIPVVRLADLLGFDRTFLDPDSGERKSDRRDRLADRRSKKRLSPKDAKEGAEEPEEDDESAEVKQRRKGDRRYRADSDMNVVIVKAGSLTYGLVVENLHETVEIVVKPLGKHLKKLKEYAGATIMGNGQVALILDVGGLASLAKLGAAGAGALQESRETEGPEQTAETQTLLLFKNSPSEPCAVPLDLVTRIERVEASNIQTLAGQRMIQYRNMNLPLIALGDVANVAAFEAEGEVIVLISKAIGKEVGVLAHGPLDIVETVLTQEQGGTNQKGIFGSIIIDGVSTIFVDIYELVESARPEWVADSRPEGPVDRSKAKQVTILLAEDSEFFRNQVTRFLQSDGYKVLAAEDGLAAWELLKKNADKVNLVVTDIEMPRMNGLELTRKIKSDSGLSGIPVIGLTSLAGEEDVALGKSAGIDEYQIKLDKNNLLAGIGRWVSELGNA